VHSLQEMRADMPHRRVKRGGQEIGMLHVREMRGGLPRGRGTPVWAGMRIEKREK